MRTQESSITDVLLVEDNHGDVNLIERTFDRRDVPGRLHTVQSAETALDCLHREDGDADVPRPDIVLQDLNLPGTSGHAVIDAVASEPSLYDVPVVVLTGSRSTDDVVRAYELGANAYLVKPTDPEAFADLVETAVTFWTAAVTPPANPDSSERA